MTNTSSDCAEIAPVTKFSAHNDYILRCVLSPDTKYVTHAHIYAMLVLKHHLYFRLLATCSADKTVKIWNTEQNFKLQMTLTGHQRWVWDCAFSADSAYVVTGKDSC